MSLFEYTAAQLYNWLTTRQDMVVLDVRNSVDFSRFKVESPYPFELLNVSYFDFMEIEDESVAKVPLDRPIRVVCAKEGSAKFVAEILIAHGGKDVGYLGGGIKSWGNLLVPSKVAGGKGWELYQCIRPGKASCSYALVAGGEMALFDPSRNTQFYLDFADKLKCRITRTFETHLQADYIAGSRHISESTGAEFFANSSDFKGAALTYTEVEHEAEYTSGPAGPSVQAICTPGHTPGSTCYLIDGTYLISGDTVFLHSVGRPDLGGQVETWSDMLYDTLQKVKGMKGDTVVLPGHYMEWDEANEHLVFAAKLSDVLEFNKAIYDLGDKTSFQEFIKANMRKQPEEYATIRLINANLEQVDDDKAEELDLGKNECAASAYAASQEASKS